jgi:hypothetical protein
MEAVYLHVFFKKTFNRMLNVSQNINNLLTELCFQTTLSAIVFFYGTCGLNSEPQNSEADAIDISHCTLLIFFIIRFCSKNVRDLAVAFNPPNVPAINALNVFQNRLAKSRCIIKFCLRK